MTARITALLLLILDLVATVIVFNLISYARGVAATGTIILGPLLAPLIAYVTAIYLVQGYRARTDMLSVDYASQHTIASLGAMLTTLVVTYVVFPSGYELQSSRFVIALSFVALVPITLGYRRLVYLRTVAAHDRRSIVFVGDRASYETFREECRRMEMTHRLIYSVAGHNHTATPFQPGEGAEVRPFREVLDEIQAGKVAVEAIVLRESARELAPEISRQLVQLYFAGVPTYTLELFHEIYWQKIPLYRLNQTWLFQEGFQIAREPVFERTKRATDILLALAGLVIATPLVAVAALAIWLDDRGPIFFTQTRIGKNHIPFQLVKLRTMKTGGTTGPRYTQPGDARITRAGRFLRATRCDEIPQLWNVLRGDMSLIGPRAEWDQLVEEYEREISCYHFRHLVKPGITGWAQVNYPYGASLEDARRKLQYDLYYVCNASPLLDLRTLLRTARVVLFRQGSR